MKILDVVLGTILFGFFIPSCVYGGAPSTKPIPETIQTKPFQAPLDPTAFAIRLNELRSSDELNKEILQEVHFFAGGAGCGTQNIGVSGSCVSSEQWPIVLQLRGVFRVSNQGMVNQLPWWGEKFASCYDTLEFGDMVYFSAKGFPEGEEVEFTIHGPNEKKTYVAIVEKDVVSFGGLVCTPYATAPAARLSWIVEPGMGAGNYLVTAEGKSGKATLAFTVTENQVPNFGVSVGDTSLPLVLGPKRTINLVYSKFEPNQIMTTLLYNPKIDAGPSNPIRYINIQMDGNGSAVQAIKWDPTLPPGKYWFLVPDIVPDTQPNPKYSDFPVEPALWGVYFYADAVPEYDPDRLYLSTQDILLRPSCGNELTVQANKTINLRYGVWGVNGLDLLEETKDKIITRLLINGEEVVGYRSNKVIPMSEMQCGSSLENGYFLYSETQIGPFGNYSDPTLLEVRVEYSFTDVITDGYDLTPQDGKSDQYNPSTPFQQSFKIKLEP